MIAGEYAGYVLAGGRSSRMGTDKALLTWGGEALVCRVARAIEQALGIVTIVGDPARYGLFGYPVIPDTLSGCGPLAGMQAALTHTRAPWNLIVACDMPGVSAKGLAGLLRQSRQYPAADVSIPYMNGNPQPLCALYHIRALPAIEQALRSGRFKIMDALAPLRTAAIPVENEELFANINTPEEWRTLVGRTAGE